MKAREYRRLGRVEKLAYAYERMRDNPVECPACQNQVLPRDMESHQTRCMGRQWAGKSLGVAWMPWREIAALGVSWGCLKGWLHAGKVRRQLQRGKWLYSRVDMLRALEGVEERAQRRRSRRARWAALHRWFGHGGSDGKR